VITDGERSDTIPPSPQVESRTSDGTADETTSRVNASETMSTNVIEAPVTGLHLSDELEGELLQVFKLLSDETRLRILLHLSRERELHVTALCSRLGQSQPAVSHHLALLREADLIEPRRDGKHNYYSLKHGHFHSIIERLFESMVDPEKSEIRFDEFVLLHGQDSEPDKL